MDRDLRTISFGDQLECPEEYESIVALNCGFAVRDAGRVVIKQQMPTGEPRKVALSLGEYEVLRRHLG
jgi:hypothetical protein